MNTVKPLTRTLPRHDRCGCANVSPFRCVAIRYNVSVTMVRCLGGCKCSCHQDKDGADIANETWQHMMTEQEH